MNLFSYDSVSQKETTKKESMSNVKRDEFEAEKDYLGYYFANQKEFIIFVTLIV